MIPMVVADPKGFDFCRIDLQELHVFHDPLGIGAKIEKAAVGFPVDDGFNLVGQTVLAVRCGVQRRYNSLESFGYLFI